MCYVRVYLRASTDEQDATRAREQVETFATERGLIIVSWYTENESGAKLARPELFRLLADACDDILLIEHVDRLSRLTAPDWETLKALVKRSETSMFDGMASSDKDPRRSLHVEEVPLPELAPDEAYVAVKSLNDKPVRIEVARPKRR